MTIIQMRWYKVRLPSIYQEVEYISSPWWTSWPYINTWVVPYWKRFTINCELLFLSLVNRYLYWTNSWWWTTYERWGWRFSYNAWSTTWILANSFNPSINTKYILNVDYNNWTLTETVTSWWTSTIKTWTYSWNLANASIPFMWEGSNSFQNVNIYSLQMYLNNELVRDFVPCYRKSDSVIWMYDLVTDTFYTNAWSWTFSKWSDV